MARTYRTGDLVTYRGSKRSLHGVYTIVGTCTCACCHRARMTAERAVDGIRWRIADAERVLGCVHPTSLTPAANTGPCADCGGKRDTTGPWCSACLMVWADERNERADYC